MHGMPDTTTPKAQRTSFLYRRSNILLILAALSVTFMLFAPHFVGAQDNAEDQYEDGNDCADPNVVETFEGNTSQETQPFDINAESWQVVVETQAAAEENFSFTFVDVIENESFSAIASRDFDNNEGGVIDVQGSGTYYLDIFTDLQSYSVTVQECGGSVVPPEDGDGSDGQEDVDAGSGDNGSIPGGDSAPGSDVEDDAEDQDGRDVASESASAAQEPVGAQSANGAEITETPATGGPPLSVVAALLLWTGVAGLLAARRFA